MLLAVALTSAQLNLIIAVAVVFAALFAGNSVLLALFFHKRAKSKLCTEELQHRREQLLEELHNLQLRAVSGGLSVEDLDDEDDAVDEADDEADEDLQDDVDSDEAVSEADNAAAFNAEIMAVSDMPESMRVKHGLAGEENEHRRFYVRPSYSFDAKLRSANYDVRNRYVAVANALYGISGCKLKRSFRQERAYLGRKTAALLLFRGKKLCIALALNPSVYAETKYRGVDVSDKKRFVQTPMLIKLTSDRKADYAVYLVRQLAAGLSAPFAEYNGQYGFEPQTRDEMLLSGNVKYTLLGEVDASIEQEDEDGLEETAVIRAGILAVNDMSSATRAVLGLVGSVYDGKRYYVRYNYSFEAKLRSATEVMKSRYESLLAEAYCYKRLTVKETFKGVRLSVGRKSVGQILFKGKTLCLALALNPELYADTKYRGIDVSSVKRFAQTPMLLKLTSDRRLGYAKYLLTKVAENYGLAPHYEGIEVRADVSEMDVNQLFNAGLIKIAVIGEAPAIKK